MEETVQNDGADVSQQEEEILALEAIYGEEGFVYDGRRKLCKGSVPVQFFLPDASTPAVALHVQLPTNYPSVSPPSCTQIVAPHLSDDVKLALADSLVQAYQPGQVVLFDWIEQLKAEPTLWQASSPAAQAPSLDPSRAEVACPDIVHGEPLTERKSTFQAHVATVHNIDEVEAVMGELLKVNKIRTATHNIMAYRIRDSSSGALLQDFDDDGEDAAGGRLLHLLQVADAQDVVVVVSRWFGGMLLGPSRFAVINNTARQLLEAQGFITAGKASGGKK